jgi:hypothetical protein
VIILPCAVFLSCCDVHQPKVFFCTHPSEEANVSSCSKSKGSIHWTCTISNLCCRSYYSEPHRRPSCSLHGSYPARQATDAREIRPLPNRQHGMFSRTESRNQGDCFVVFLLCYKCPEDPSVVLDRSRLARGWLRLALRPARCSLLEALVAGRRQRASAHIRCAACSSTRRSLLSILAEHSHLSAHLSSHAHRLGGSSQNSTSKRVLDT